MLEKLLKICETEQINGSHVKRIFVESINEEGDQFIDKHGSTFMGKYFNIHQNEANTTSQQRNFSIQDAVVEIIFASQVKHENIAPLLGYFCVNREVVLVYEEPLCQLMDNVCEDTLLDSINKIIDAVLYIHSLRIVHGSIEPSCFYVFPGGKIKLMFASKTLIVPTGTESAIDLKMYSLKYRPIECYNGIVSFSSDIWALGCTIYNLVYKSDFFPEQPSEEAHFSCLKSWKENVKNVFGNSIEVPTDWGKLENFTLNLLILKMFNSQKEIRPTIFKVKEEMEKIKYEEIGSPDSTTSFIESNFQINRIETCRYNPDTIIGRSKTEIIRRLSNKDHEFKSIVMIIYGNVSNSVEFRESCFDLSLCIADLMIGKRPSFNDEKIFQELKRSNCPLFSLREYYDL